MKPRKPIGGFFELEPNGNGKNIHKNGVGLSNGRTCINTILKNANPGNVYIPFYCCDTLLSPFIKNNIDYTFYSIDKKFEPTILPELRNNELFLYINYYGLKSSYVHHLVNHYGNQVIIDNTHAYFEQDYLYGWSFNSSRKFFGVPDGAYLYSPYSLEVEYERNSSYITEHLELRLAGKYTEAYKYFQRNEELQNCNFYKISNFSENILNSIDYEVIKSKRRQNFLYYQKYLSNTNELKGIQLESSDIPFCYPYLTLPMDLSCFYKNEIFIPVLWNEVLCRKNDNFLFERKISSSLLPLPVDHRYNETDIARVINFLNKII